MWSVTRTLSLIDDVHSAPCLWDVQSKEYRDRTLKSSALSGLGQKYNCAASDIEKKVQGLKTQFRREHRKLTEFQKSGVSPRQPSWFGYDPLRFLLQGNESRGSRSTDDAPIAETDDDNEGLEETYTDLDSSTSESAEPSVMVVEPEHPALASQEPLIDGSQEVNRGKMMKEFQSPPEPKRRNKDPYTTEVLRCMRKLSDSVGPRDEFSVYGEHIAHKLRNSGRSRVEIAMAQRQIDEVCFKLTVGEFSGLSLSPTQTTSLSQSSPMTGFKQERD